MFVPLLPVFNLKPTQIKRFYLYYCQAPVLREEAFPPRHQVSIQQRKDVYYEKKIKKKKSLILSVQRHGAKQCLQVMHFTGSSSGFVINLSKCFSSDLGATGRLLIIAIPSGPIQLHLFHFLRPNLGCGCARIFAVHNIK